MTYQEQYDRCRDMVEERLAQYFTGKGLEEVMRYSLLAGGKRVRPVLTLAFCEALGGNMQGALSLGVALECVHTYSLIHDDLPCMDDDDLRRGRPSCHKAYGEATALLAGDALLTAAFEALSAARGTARQNVQAVQLLSRAAGANGMVWGQEQDLYYEAHAALVGEEQLKAIHRSKTGELIRAAALLGAIAANADGRQCEAVGEYAEAVGMVFQIMDDVLDVTATEQFVIAVFKCSWIDKRFLL